MLAASTFMIVTWLGMITVTAGWIKWIKHASDFDSVGTSFGLGITIGAALTTITFFVGYLGVGRNIEQLVDLGDEVAATGGPPLPEQQAVMDGLGAKLERYGKIDLTLLILALIAMATARYW